MNNLVNFAMKEEFSKIKTLSKSSNLEKIKRTIEWNKFISLFPERKTLTGRPPYEKLLMVRLLFLQGWYGISDEELEFQVNDRLLFRNFLILFRLWLLLFLLSLEWILSTHSPLAI